MTTTKKKQIALRLDETVLSDVEALRAMIADYSGIQLDRSEIIRIALRSGLDREMNNWTQMSANRAAGTRRAVPVGRGRG
jgi:Arc/MetJ-type ribon-helix-helix transcriptional regulator